MLATINDENEVYINGVKINNKIFDEEMIYYVLRERDELIDNLIDWIAKATTYKDAMKEDLKYLMSLKDNFIFSSISTNKYIARSDNEEVFNDICEEILKLNEGLV